MKTFKNVQQKKAFIFFGILTIILAIQTGIWISEKIEPEINSQIPTNITQGSVKS